MVAVAGAGAGAAVDLGAAPGDGFAMFGFIIPPASRGPRARLDEEEEEEADDNRKGPE